MEQMQPPDQQMQTLPQQMQPPQQHQQPPQQHQQPPQQQAWPFSAFFGPWEPCPPAYAPPPPDPAMVERIALLCRHGLTNGPSFIQTVRERQAQDLNFSFLFGGDHPAANYWKWALYCASLGLPADKPNYPVQQSQQSLAPAQHAHAPGNSMQLSPEVEQGFGQVLEALTGSKESIKASQQWFMACGPAAVPGLARMMAVRCVASSTEPEKRLHIIYLTNDILFKGVAARPAGMLYTSDPVACGLLPMLMPMMAAAYNASGRTEEMKAKMEKILKFWSERGVFDAAIAVSIQEGMTVTENPAGALAQAVAQQAAANAAIAAATTAAANAAAATAAATAAANAMVAANAMAAANAAAAAAAAAGPPPPQYGHPGYPPGAYGGPGPPGQSGGWAPHAPPHMQPPGSWGGPPPGMPHPGYNPGWGMPPQQPGPPPPHLQFAPPNGQPPPQQGLWGFPPPGQSMLGAMGMAGGFVGPPPDMVMAGHQMHPQHPQFQHVMPPPQQPSPEAEPPSPPRAPRVSRFHSGPVVPPGGHALPPDAPAAPPAPAREPVSSFNFPPGLLPQLSRKQQESGAKPYEPLLAEDIADMGLPPPPTKDDYLASRMEHFFAEVRDFRPGMTRADVEDPMHIWHRQRLRKEYEEDPEGLRQKWWRGGGRRAAGGRGESGKVHVDGTYSGGGSMYAGLGMGMKPKETDSPAGSGPPGAPVQGEQGGAPPAGVYGDGVASLDDMYKDYRSSRSGGYHTMIMHSAAKAQTYTSVVPRKRP